VPVDVALDSSRSLRLLSASSSAASKDGGRGTGGPLSSPSARGETTATLRLSDASRGSSNGDKMPAAAGLPVAGLKFWPGGGAGSDGAAEDPAAARLLRRARAIKTAAPTAHSANANVCAGGSPGAIARLLAGTRLPVLEQGPRILAPSLWSEVAPDRDGTRDGALDGKHEKIRAEIALQIRRCGSDVVENVFRRFGSGTRPVTDWLSPILWR
jgi:hypothetical protein